MWFLSHIIQFFLKYHFPREACQALLHSSPLILLAGSQKTVWICPLFPLPLYISFVGLSFLLLLCWGHTQW